MHDKRKGLAAIGLAARTVALPGAPLRSAAHHTTAFEETNPTRLPSKLPPTDQQILAEIMRESIPPQRTSAARSVAHPGAPQRPRTLHSVHPEKTNPTAVGALELTSRQLAAARLTVQGMASEQIAQRLGTIRQTVNRWKRLPAFIAELRRLHEMLVRETR